MVAFTRYLHNFIYDLLRDERVTRSTEKGSNHFIVTLKFEIFHFISAPTPEDYDVSSQLQQMLNDCFPEGCKPWIAKDLPAKIEAHIAEIINERYFFAHVTNGLPVSYSVLSVLLLYYNKLW